MREVKLALLGFGNAARAFMELLMEKEREIRESRGVRVSVTAVATASRGCLENPAGLSMKKHMAYLKEAGSFDAADPDFCKKSPLELAETAHYDILLEMTPLEIFSGEPAISHMEAALKRGKHAVSANKGPLAWGYRRLRDLAAAKDCCFFFETAVMDGTPVFNLRNETLKFCKVTGIKGILNSTTNFILEEMERGTDRERIMEEGRRRGFIEADPAMDIEGWDAAAKLTVLMNVLMDADLDPTRIRRQGVENIGPADIEAARKKGCKIKLLCQGTLESGRPAGIVRPVEISREDIYANLSGTSSVVTLETDLMGALSIVEHEPEIRQTGYGLFSDVIRVIDTKYKK